MDGRNRGGSCVTESIRHTLQSVKERLSEKLWSRTTQGARERACTTTITSPITAGEELQPLMKNIEFEARPSIFETIDDVLKRKKLQDVVVAKLTLADGKNYLELKRKFPDLKEITKGGPMHSARAIVDELGHATFQVLHHPQWETELEDGGNVNMDNLDTLLDLLNHNHYLCVGMSPDDFRDISKDI